MDKMRPAARRLAPPSVWQNASKAYWWWRNRGNHRLAAALSPRRAASVRALRGYRDCHRGSRCFIIGNGPSLNQTELPRLRGEFTFGMNRIYLLFPELGFATSYYVAINTLVIDQCAAEIQALSLPKFVTWRGRRWLGTDPRTVFLDTDYTDPPTFSPDVTGRVFEGSTVTYVALQLAFHMGFDQVILIGVDHNFTTTGPANTTVVSEGDDRDHFSAGYFGKGFRWQLPDLAASEAAYRMARQAYEEAGRRVVDATVGGKLTVFPKVEYASLF